MVITGGEPMLYPNLLIKGLELAKEFGIRCSINSNLTRVTPEIVTAIKDNNSQVLTSMLSYKRLEHDKLTCSKGSYVRLLNGIQTLISAGIFVGVNMVVMRQNLDDVYETGKFVKELAVKSFTATKVTPSLGDDIFEEIKISKEDNIKIFEQLLRLQKDFNMNVDSLTAFPSCLSENWDKYGKFLLKRSCSAGKTFCAIGSNGQLRACVQHDKEYGSVIDTPITSIWPALKKWRDGSYLPDECKKCSYLFACGGGCRVTCQFCGDIKSLDPDANGRKFNPICSKDNNVEKIDLNVKLSINQSLRFRVESFGVILIVDGLRKSTVTKDTAYLLRKLNKKPIFTLAEIFSDYDLSVELVHNFFSSLYEQKVFVLVDNN